MINECRFLQELKQQFHKLQPFLPGSGLLDIRHLRANALQEAFKIGLPQPYHVQWKHALLNPLFATGFEAYLHPSEEILAKIIHSHLTDAHSNSFVFINGFYAPKYSKMSDEASGLTLSHFTKLSRTQPELLQDVLESSLSSNHFFHKINSAFVNDGMMILIPAGWENHQPILIHHFLINFSDKAMMVHPQTHIMVGKNAKAVIIEKYISISESTCFFNSQTFLDCKEYAKTSYHRLAVDSALTYGFSHLKTRQHYGSDLHITDIMLGSQYHRMERRYHLQEPNATCKTYGLMLVNSHQHGDWVSHLEHADEASHSEQTIHAVVGNEAHSSFLGKITVTQHAPKTVAKMENYNLLLSDKGKADTAPQLEILTDDVQCTHGAAVGKLDEDAIFYLRSRGLSELQAKTMLINSFVKKVIDHIDSPPIQQEFSELVDHTLLTISQEGK